MSEDNTTSILRSASRFSAGTLISRISGVIRDVTMAYAFGTGPHVAAFLVAYRFAHLLRRLLGEGAMQSAFIPLFESLKHESLSKAAFFYRHMRRVLTTVLLLIITVGCGGLAGLLLYGHLPSSQAEIISLTLVMLPSLLFICLYGLNASLLQCHHRYFLPGLSPVIFNLVWTGGVLWLLQTPEQEAMPYLAAVIVLASFGQWISTVPVTNKILAAYPSVSKNKNSDISKIGTPMLLGTLGVAATQINNFLDALFARYASLNGPAFLWYAVRIEQLPLALFGIALASAILPPLSRAFKNGNRDQYNSFLSYSIEKTSLILIPLSFAMAFLAVPGIVVLYGRGDFGIASVEGTTHCLWAYALGLWPMGMVQVFAPAFYARSNYRNPTIASATAMAVNIILNTIFVFYLGWSAMSVALATSFSAWINMLILGWGLYRRGAFKNSLGSVIRTIFTALLAGVIGTIILLALDEEAIEPLIIQADILLNETFIHRLIKLLSQSMLFALGFLGIFLTLGRSLRRR